MWLYTNRVLFFLVFAIIFIGSAAGLYLGKTFMEPVPKSDFITSNFSYDFQVFPEVLVRNFPVI